MRVCILTTSYPLRDGHAAGHFVQEGARELAALGHSVAVVAPGSKNAPPTESRAGVQIHRFSYFPIRALQRVAYGSGILPNLKRSPLAWMQLPSFILAFMRKASAVAEDCDIIHAHWSISAYVALKIRRRMDIPVILSLRGSDSSRQASRIVAKLTRSVLKRVDGIITLSPLFVEPVREYSAPHTPIAAIRNGVDFVRFSPGKDRSILRGTSAENATPILLFAGRLSSVKGPDVALNALEPIVARFPQACLVFVGDGDMKKELLNRVARTPSLKGHVHFAGEFSASQMPACYKAADLLVISSRSEGVPNVLYEALASGVPAAALPVGGIPEIMTNHEIGFLAEHSTPQSLAEAILEALTDQDNLAEVGRRGRRWVEDTLSWRETAKRYVSFYSQAMTRMRESETQSRKNMRNESQ